MTNPKQVAIDGAGNVYASETGEVRSRRSPPDDSSSSCVTTVGSGFGGFGGVAVDASGNRASLQYFKHRGQGDSRRLHFFELLRDHRRRIPTPGQLAVDSDGDVYVADDGGTTPSKKSLIRLFLLQLRFDTGWRLQRAIRHRNRRERECYVADAQCNAPQQIPASCIAGANNSGCVLTVKSGLRPSLPAWLSTAVAILFFG